MGRTDPGDTERYARSHVREYALREDRASDNVAAGRGRRRETAVPIWAGWSTDPMQVEKTRLLGSLVADLRPDGQTTRSPDAVAEELGLTLAVFTAVTEWESDGYIEDGGMVPGANPVLVTRLGMDVAAEFADASKHRVQERAARRALLRWLYDVDRQVNTHDMQETPYGWFYGQQFSVDVLTGVARWLVKQQWISGTATMQGPVIRSQLTDAGVRCVEEFDGDIRAMEAAAGAIPAGVNIANYHQFGGNAAIGSDVGQQTSVTVAGGDSADLRSLLDLVLQHGAVSDELAAEVAEIQSELATADTDEKARLVHGRARQLLGRLKPVVDPIVRGAVGLGYSYLEMKAGIS